MGEARDPIEEQYVQINRWEGEEVGVGGRGRERRKRIKKGRKEKENGKGIRKGMG